MARTRRFALPWRSAVVPAGTAVPVGAPRDEAPERTERTGRAHRPVIELDGIAKVYRMGDIRVAALRGVSLTVMPGEFLSVMGASGSGKSTMMNILGCLDTPSAGRYLLDGVDVRRLGEDTLARVRNRKIGFVFQSFNLIPRTSAVANVELPLTYARVAPRERRARALAALDDVGLGDRANHLPSELSGGQTQRVAVARAIASNPSLILADEPTGNLDTVATHEVMQIFAGLHEAGRTVVVITHEPEVAGLTNRIVRLRDGLVVSDELTDQGRRRAGKAGAGNGLTGVAG
jgi:putative ABC transport system ATP-binding protein